MLGQKIGDQERKIDYQLCVLCWHYQAPVFKGTKWSSWCPVGKTGLDVLSYWRKSSPLLYEQRGHSKFYNFLGYSLKNSWREALIGVLEVAWNIEKQSWRKQVQKIRMSSSLLVGFRSWVLFLYRRCSQQSLRVFFQDLLKIKWCNLKMSQTISMGVCLLKAF